MSLLSNVPGYTVSILFQGEKAKPNQRGFLNNCSAGKFTIILSPDKNIPTDKFEVTDVYRVSNRSKNIITIDKSNGWFEHEVEIKCNTDSRESYTTNNTVRFLVYNAATGQMCEYEVGVFSQRGKHFFGMAKNWRSKLCVRNNVENDVEPVIQNMENGTLIDWPQMVKYILDKTIMRPKSAYKEMTIDSAPLKKGEGRVKWFKFSNGTGAIETTKGMAKLHYKNVLREDKLAPVYLSPGQIVKVKMTPSTENTRTEFDFVAINVQPVSNTAAATA